MTAHLHIVSAGLMTTIQDLGRVGHQALGIPVAGALDPIALRVANALVGNPEGTGALEIRILGPTFQVMAESVRVALAGTAASLEILEPVPEIVPALRSVCLSRGQIFSVGATKDTAVCYLGVEGGFEVPAVYGSQSTYTRGGLGGFEGRSLRDGDSLPLSHEVASERPDKMATRLPDLEVPGPIRIVLGPQATHFSDSGLRTFLEGTYTVTRDADRMGLRLDGPNIEHALGYNITSDGIATGSIQVPGTGLPIVLLADRQTTGGYPKIATVISADLRRLGRLRPGASIRFQAIDVSEAESLRRRQEDQVRDLIEAIRPVTEIGEPSSRHLLTVNLISGVFAIDENGVPDATPE